MTQGQRHGGLFRLINFERKEVAVVEETEARGFIPAQGN